MFSNPNYQTINLSFEKSHEKSALDVLALFQKLKANNNNRLSKWNITPGSDIAIKMNWTFFDKQTNELKICSAPAFSILVKGAAFEGGIIVLKDQSGKYKVLLFGLNHKMIEQKPVSEKQLLDFLDKLINVNPIFPMSS